MGKEKGSISNTSNVTNLHNSTAALDDLPRFPLLVDFTQPHPLSQLFLVLDLHITTHQIYREQQQCLENEEQTHMHLT